MRPAASAPAARLWLRSVVCSALLLALAPGAEGQPPRRPGGALARQLAALVDHPEVREAHWGVSVVSLKRGSALAAINGEKLFIPASTVKLFAAAAGLSLLGSDYRYKTGIYISKSNDGSGLSDSDSQSGESGSISQDGEVTGDLIVVGRGDPNLSGRTLPFDKSTERMPGVIPPLSQLADAVAARGIRSVRGNLIADDTYFVHQPYGMGWEHDDLMWLSAAQVSALAANDNLLFLSVLPDVPGQPALIQELPMAGTFEIDNRAVTVSRTVSTAGGGTRRSRRNLGIGREPGSQRLSVWGEIPEGSAESSYAISLEDPPRFAAEYLRKELAQRGIAVSGRLEVRRVEPAEVSDLEGAPLSGGTDAAADAGTLLAEHVSLPLSESLRVMLKVSQNLHAEMLLRTLGRERRGVGSAEAGLAAIGDFLSSNNIPSRGLVLRDGSGLSRQNMISPEAMTALLKHMYRSEQGGAAWTALLSEAGVDGTLRNRLRGRYTTGRVWAKTGSLLGVLTLAGYVRNQSDELLAFAIFANNFHDDSEGNVLTVIDRIVTTLARSR